MSSLADDFTRLAGDLGTRKVSDEQFFAVFHTDARDAQAFGLRVLERALAERDGVLVELGTYTAFRFGLAPQSLDVLIGLADARWHRAHEDVVELLKRLRDPRSVDVLCRLALATPEHLHQDDADSLRKKCLWALEAIPSERALEALARFADSDDEVLATSAVQQLTFVAVDSPEPALRELAKVILARRDRLHLVLKNALERFDSTLLELALAEGERFGLDDRSIEPLVELARHDFHHRHEELRAALASIGSEAARRALST